MNKKNIMSLLLTSLLAFSCNGGGSSSASSQSQASSSSEASSSSSSEAPSSESSQSKSSEATSSASSDIGGITEFKNIRAASGNYEFNGLNAKSSSANAMALFNQPLSFKGVEVVVNGSKGEDADSGIVFNYANQSGGRNAWEGNGISFHFLYVSKLGFLTLASSINGTTSILKQYQIKNYSKSDSHTIKVFQKDNRIFGYANGFLCFFYDVTSPLSGKLFGVRTTAANVSFSNLLRTSDESDLGFVTYRNAATYATNFDLVEGWNILRYTDQNSVSIETAIYLPKKYDASKKYPIELFLHGDGTVGANALNNLFYGEASCMARKPAFEHPEDMIIIVPASLNTWMMFYAWTHPGYTYGHNEYGGISVNKELTCAVNLLDKCCNALSVDTNRIYLTGYSKGCHSSQYLMAMNPNLFTAAVLVAGRGDPACAKNFKDVPCWWWTGNSDVDVEPEESTTMYNAYTEAGGVGRISRINGRDHGSIQIDLTNSDEWYDFLVSKTKEGRCMHTYGTPEVIRKGTSQCFEMYEAECTECHAKKVTYGSFGA